MRWLRDLPIKRKLSLAVMLTTAMALSLACVILMVSEVVTFRRDMAHGLIVLANGIGYNTTAALVFNDPAAAAETLSALKVEPHVICACLYAKDNTLFAQYVRENTQVVFPDKPGLDGYVFARDHLTLFRPVVQNKQQVGTIYVQADLEAMYARLGLYARVVLMALMAALLVAWMLSAFLQRLIAKPILELAATARTISEKKDYSIRVEIPGQDELGTLTHGFNQMLASIEERETALSQTNVALRQEISERIRAQEELTRLNETLEQRVVERTREAVEANRAKSEFLANMSHELRTPLNSVIGFANILLKNKHQNLRQDEMTFLERITVNGKHLLNLINQILDLSKIEARKVDLEITVVGLDVMVREVLSQMEGQVRSRSVRLVAELPSTVAPIETDGGKLRQVLINLVGNALKFTDKGRVVVRVVTDPATGRPTRVDVADSGVGIPKERLGMIFEAFQQADVSTARKYGGTGLGLTISQALCQLMGYRIEVASEPDKGSTFSIVLGRSEARPGSRTDLVPPVAAQPPVKGFTTVHGRTLHEWSGLKLKIVLVIDDEPDARLLLAHIIEESGCRVVTAGSGEEGLRMAREIQPDLITLDLLMPVMDGMTFLNRIRNDVRYRQMPVVVCTVKELGSRENLRLSQQAQAVLQKAEDLEKELKRVLHELLRHSPAEGWRMMDRKPPAG